MGVTSSELDVLEILARDKNPMSMLAISRRLGGEPAYARFLCKSLAKNDYVEFTPNGLCRITYEGKGVLWKYRMKEEGK